MLLGRISMSREKFFCLIRGLMMHNALFWWPHAPNLIDAELTLLGPAGEVIDTVTSYTAMRGVAIIGDRFFLNGRPFKLQLVLDQGYWPQTGLSPRMTMRFAAM